MVLFRKLLSLSFVNLSLKRGLVWHTHHYFGANIRESESHGKEQISSQRLLKRWEERKRGRQRWEELEESRVQRHSGRDGGNAWDSWEVYTWVLVHERLGLRTFRPPAPS